MIDQGHAAQYSDDDIDLMQLLRMWPQMLGLGIIFGVVSLVAGYVAFSKVSSETTMRVAFSFAGFEKGRYPDNSKFQPDDVRAADIVAEAVMAAGLDPEVIKPGELRRGISVRGIMPQLKDREVEAMLRLRQLNPQAAQEFTQFVPDEYEMTLAGGSALGLSLGQRERLLIEVVAAFVRRFQRTHAVVPPQYGNVVKGLGESEYYEYAAILESELSALEQYLLTRLKLAPAFRDPISALSFADLIAKVQLFEQLQVNDLVSAITIAGVSRSKAAALVKINFQLEQLASEERYLSQSMKMVESLIGRVEQRQQSYLVGAQVQGDKQRPNLIDQGVFESLIENDSYNLLVKRALDIGTQLEGVRKKQLQLSEQQKRVADGVEFSEPAGQVLQSQVDGLIKRLNASYDALVADVRAVIDSYNAQYFADAVRITRAPVSDSGVMRKALILGLAGGVLGALLGLGKALVGAQSGARRRRAHSSQSD